MRDPNEPTTPIKARKREADPVAEAPTPTPTAVNDLAGSGGAAIVAELEQRFETLRQWHTQTAAQFDAQRAELDKDADVLKQKHAEADALRRGVEADQDQLRQAREKLEHDRAAFETYCRGEEAALAKQKLACEEWVAAQHAASEAAITQKQSRAQDEIAALKAKADAEVQDEYRKLSDAQADLDAERERLQRQRDELARVRRDLDAEWDSVRMVRAAEEATLKAWQNEHERVQRHQLKFVPAATEPTPTKPAKAA